MKEIYFAGGCFWGMEHFFKQIKGVIHTKVGFANGNTDNPSYEEVYTDTTGYAETVKIQYDENKVSLAFLLDMFFHAINPTILNKQGNDEGTRYRTGVYFSNNEDKQKIVEIFLIKQKEYDMPIVTEIEPLKNFYPASEYHQNYLDKHPYGYCHLPSELFLWVKKQKDETK
ncbi:MAG: peptide-methionine (S)-S-oxide reductase MsrA [Bacteroidales bacterium]